MSLFTELKRRNVFRVAIAYLALAWLVTEVASTLFPTFGIPEWGLRFLVIVFALGLVPTLIVSWVYEITPEGLKREKDVVRDASITHLTARRLDMFTIGLIVVALGFILTDRLWLSPRLIGQSVVPRDVATDSVKIPELQPAEPAHPVNSVAVLPFDDLSPDGDQGWFSDGLSEEIINSLAQLPELKVTARTSAFHFKDLDLPIPEIAATLGVAHVVEGSVRRAGERMRITAQLIKADDGFHLWSETYDRSTDDVFAVQEDIAVNIASTLDIYLDEERRERMLQTGTRDVQAYEAYLRGQQLYDEAHKRLDDVGIFWEAQSWLERALEHDPQFAEAHFSHADAYFHYADGHIKLPADADSGLTPAMAVDLLFQDYDRAIEFAHNDELRILYQAERTLISDNWSAFRSLLDQLETIRRTSVSPIFVRWHQSDTAFALLGLAGIESNYRHFKRILELNPLESIVLHGATVCALGLGLHDEAQKFMQQRENIRPQGSGYSRFLFLMQTGQYDEYLRYADTQPPKGVMNSAIADRRTLALVLAGRHDEARALIEQLMQEPDAQHSLELGMALNMLGDTRRAAELFGAIDSRRLYSTELLTLHTYNWSGRLVWDLEWTPNYAARLAELGVKLEPYAFPSPAE